MHVSEPARNPPRRTPRREPPTAPPLWVGCVRVTGATVSAARVGIARQSRIASRAALENYFLRIRFFVRQWEAIAGFLHIAQRFEVFARWQMSALWFPASRGRIVIPCARHNATALSAMAFDENRIRIIAPPVQSVFRDGWRRWRGIGAVVGAGVVRHRIAFRVVVSALEAKRTR